MRSNTGRRPDQTEPGRPHDNCYWVEPGRLLAGEYPGDTQEDVARGKLKKLLEHGVTFFLDLTEERDRLEPYAKLLKTEARLLGVEVTHKRAPLPDYDVPRSRREMVDILDTIDEAVARNRCVYVHCWGGIGRTGVVVGCYLVRHGRSGQEALDDHWETIVKRVRHPETPQTPAQRQLVREWSEPLRSDAS